MKKFELIDHTADIGIKVKGNSLKEIFKNLAIGMFKIMVETKKNKGQSHFSSRKIGTATEKIELNSSDMVSLVHDWLSELLYIFNTKHLIFNKFKINDITDFSLNAEVSGELFNLKKHVIKKEIKSVTYYDLKIENKNNIWIGQVIFDI